MERLRFSHRLPTRSTFKDDLKRILVEEWS
jgi:hypothetical protein